MVVRWQAQNKLRTSSARPGGQNALGPVGGRSLSCVELLAQLRPLLASAPQVFLTILAAQERRFSENTRFPTGSDFEPNGHVRRRYMFRGKAGRFKIRAAQRGFGLCLPNTRRLGFGIVPIALACRRTISQICVLTCACSALGALALERLQRVAGRVAPLIRLGPVLIDFRARAVPCPTHCLQLQLRDSTSTFSFHRRVQLSQTKRMIYEGQLVSAAIDIKVIGNVFVTIDAGSFLRKSENCGMPAGTKGFVKCIDDTRILVHFRPHTNSMVALWFAKTIVGNQLHLFDELYEG